MLSAVEKNCKFRFPDVSKAMAFLESHDVGPRSFTYSDSRILEPR